MYLSLDACGNRANVAAKKYVEKYPESCLPNADVFDRLDQRTRESYTVLQMLLIVRILHYAHWTAVLREIIVDVAKQDPHSRVHGTA
jgi:hypothetical protein